MNSTQRKRYRKALSHLSATIHVDSTKHRPAMKWCEQQFGKRWNLLDYPDGSWASFWGGTANHDQYRFVFVNEEDAVLFSLRWL